MSSVAQKQDIYNPEVIHAFAQKVGSERRLVGLYLLTVADVRGTSPKVWNAWKGKLLEDLFRAARSVLTGGELRLDSVVADRQAEALRLLRLYALSDSVKDKFWHSSTPRTSCATTPMRSPGRPQPSLPHRLGQTGCQGASVDDREGLQVMVYTPDRKELFAHICGYFERANFNIVEAKIHTTRHGYAIDTFYVMGDGRGAHYRDMISLIETQLSEELQLDAPLRPPVSGRVSRRVKHFRRRRRSTSSRREGPVSPAVDRRERPAGPALRHRTHAGALQRQPAHGQDQHARRPRRGRIPGKRRVTRAAERRADARAGTARGPARLSAPHSSCASSPGRKCIDEAEARAVLASRPD